MNQNPKGSIFLLSAAFVWGMAFVAQRIAAGSVSLFTFTCLRSVVTCLSLAPVCAVRISLRKKRNVPFSLRRHLLPGLIMGVLTFGAIGLQQWGLSYTTAGKSSFITALYIILVPVLGLFLRKKPHFMVWIGVGLALAGSLLLAVDFGELSEGLTVGKGELITFGCALVFSGHILYVDHTPRDLDSVLLCVMQFGVCLILGLIGMILFESPSWSDIWGNLIPILYVGGVSGAIGYTFQLVGQKYASPAVASLTMCLESVFGALGGWIIAGERLSSPELLGCFLLLCGCLLAQMSTLFKRN